MQVIVGIGNPGTRYKNNRHNVGFQLLDYYAEKKSIEFKTSKFDYYFAEGEIDSNPYLLVKPSSYVNNSGIPVLDVVKEYGISLSNLLVVVDDINIPIFSIRLRKSGGDGGHNGLSSIIYYLNSKNFSRLRIGIGKNFTAGELPDYVLSDFEEKDSGELKKVFELGSLLIDDFIKYGFQRMLNSYSKIIKQKKFNTESD